MVVSTEEEKPGLGMEVGWASRWSSDIRMKEQGSIQSARKNGPG